MMPEIWILAWVVFGAMTIIAVLSFIVIYNMSKERERVDAENRISSRANIRSNSRRG